MDGAVHLLGARLTAFTTLLDKFDTVQTEIEMSLGDNEDELAEQEENEFFLLHFAVKALILAVCGKPCKILINLF